eukprot:SM000146S00937  [mRNA]  locus=s146:39232:39903:+ [translate_table: standard]
MLVLPDRRRAALLSITAAEYVQVHGAWPLQDPIAVLASAAHMTTGAESTWSLRQAGPGRPCGGAQGLPLHWIAAAGDDGRSRSLLSAPEEGGGGLAARFTMVGNAVSVPVAQWLGERLADPLWHKYVHGALDRALPIGDSLAAWPAAAWGRVNGQRFEATALLASGFTETPVLLPFRLLGTSVGTLMREGLCAATCSATPARCATPAGACTRLCAAHLLQPLG